MAHPEIGRRILERLIEELGEVAIAETMPRQEGNQMHTILSQRAGAKRAAPKGEATSRAAAANRNRNSDVERSQKSDSEDEARRQTASCRN